MSEIIMVRNTVVKSLYDVVEVDYEKQTVNKLDTQLKFEDAVGKVEELREQRGGYQEFNQTV